jgi:endonuclease/exonuclease/phosphatase family metal-dependent hydrolase
MQETPNSINKREFVSGSAAGQGFMPLIVEVSFIALTVVFGLQTLRVFLPGLVWLLGDRMGLGEPIVGVIAFVVFLVGLTAGALQRILSRRFLIIATAGGLGLTRLLIQVGSGEELLNVILAIAGTTLFVLFIAVYASRTRTASIGLGRFALGLLLGLVFDTALHGAFDTYDISWQSGLLPLLLTSLLVLFQWVLLGVVMLSRKAVTARKMSISPLALLAVGPFLFLQVVVFQNIARVATLTEWRLPAAFGLTLLAQVLGLAVAAYLLSRGGQYRRLLALPFGIVLVAVLVISYPEGPALTTMQLVLGQVSLSVLVMLLFMMPVSRPPGRPLISMTLAYGLGMVLLLLFLLGYYVSYYVRLPFDNTVLEPIAAFLLAACALGAVVTPDEVIGSRRKEWPVAVLVLPLLVIPLVGSLTWQTPAAVSGDGYPVRLMTYNLHNGFNAGGYLNMEDLALVIEEADVDIIALQEVSRGWVISGRLDMLSWLSQRLEMSYIYGPTADPLWGNAILSRYPVIEYESYDLPPRDLPVLRGFTEVSIDLGDGDYIRLIATHFHHVEEDTGVRLLQSQRILEGWGGEGCTVLLGDLNADPHEPEMVMLREAGLVDTVAPLEPPDIYTWHANDLHRRIDYIWVTPDTTAADVSILFTKASDHLPVVAEVDCKVP